MFFVDEIFDVYNQQFLPVPGGGGKKSSVFTSHMSPQCGNYSRALFCKKLLSPPIPVGGGAVVTNDWCIIYHT